MENTNKIKCIEQIMSSTLSDDYKIYYIQSFLLHWIDEEKIIEVVNANRKEEQGTRTLEQLFTDRRNDFEKHMREFEDSYIPKTSWEEMTDNAIAEFTSYCEDEASGFLKELYESGANSGDYVLNEFNYMLWTLAQCIEQFDIPETKTIYYVSINDELFVSGDVVETFTDKDKAIELAEQTINCGKLFEFDGVTGVLHTTAIVNSVSIHRVTKEYYNNEWHTKEDTIIFYKER